MLTAIEQELTAREQSGMNESSRQPQNHDERPPVVTATALMSGNSSSPQPVCCYCSRSHKPVDCETVMQAAARKQVLKRTGRCFVCLKRGHRSRECRSAGKCRVCSGRHHSSTVGRTIFEDKKFRGFRGYLVNLENKYPRNFLYIRLDSSFNTW